MSLVLAIDPGPTDSAYCLVDNNRLPHDFDKLNNAALLELMQAELGAAYGPGRVVIEMVASYGMPVGRETFETCVWIGRFLQVADEAGRRVDLIPRQPVRLHFCHSVKAKDGNVIQALVDRFTPGQRNRGKGTKDEPGFFFGFAGDVWQSFALAVYAIDTSASPISSIGATA